MDEVFKIFTYVNILLGCRADMFCIVCIQCTSSFGGIITMIQQGYVFVCTEHVCSSRSELVFEYFRHVHTSRTTCICSSERLCKDHDVCIVHLCTSYFVHI